MQVNSIKSNQSNQSFGGIHFHNKHKLAKEYSSTLEHVLSLPHVQDVVQSKEFNLHIKPVALGLGLAYRIKAVGQGVKGAIRNFIAPWKGFYGNYIGESEIANYKTLWHPTPERVAEEKAIKAKEKLRLIEARKAEKLRIKAENEETKKGIQKLTEIENANNA